MLVILDNGHGKETPGKKSPDGRVLEWKYTRDLVKEIEKELISKGVKAVRLVPGDSDMTLGARVRKANELDSKTPAILVSVHLNAAGSGQWKTASYWSVWTTKGKTNSDKLATSIWNAADRFISPLGLKVGREMSDGDPDYESNFYILRHFNGPAVLTENMFQDNKRDVDWLLSSEGKETLVRVHVEGIINYLNSLK